MSDPLTAAGLAYCAELGLDPHETVVEARGLSRIERVRIDVVCDTIAHEAALRRAVDAVLAAERAKV